MIPTRSTARPLAVLIAAMALAACSKQAPAPSPSTPSAPTAAADPASSPLPGVIGQPSDVSATHTPGSPAAGQTAVGGLAAHPENGGARSSGTPAPTGGDAAPGHAASSASQ